MSSYLHPLLFSSTITDSFYRALEKGYIKACNVSISTPIPGSNKPIIVESTLRGRGDPGYALTSGESCSNFLSIFTHYSSVYSVPVQKLADVVMITEMALGLLQPRESLPPLAQVGGVLTPMTALGSGILKRLSASGRFEFESSVREDVN